MSLDDWPWFALAWMYGVGMGLTRFLISEHIDGYRERWVRSGLAIVTWPLSVPAITSYAIIRALVPAR